jgi:hypothetical protein
VNQGIAFVRTLRALQADDFRASKLGLFAAVALLAAWTWWLFAARVPQYESTNNVRIESGRAIAYFPSTSDMAIGQPALIHLSRATITARVQSIAPDHVDLALLANSQPLTATSVDIETARVAPAALALKTLRGAR